MIIKRSTKPSVLASDSKPPPAVITNTGMLRGKRARVLRHGSHLSKDGFDLPDSAKRCLSRPKSEVLGVTALQTDRWECRPSVSL
ncbi:hypothetical protein ROHU_024152 [Labeo rohita]|uniref:Uncharacterized protein n=1 Tax=Labeo rohita TaxID=84645 RepID=A0A498MP39_LABRO|nr:hypothetical protein ROHU_024152 [Labeo rohita]